MKFFFFSFLNFNNNNNNKIDRLADDDEQIRNER